MHVLSSSITAVQLITGGDVRPTVRPATSTGMPLTCPNSPRSLGYTSPCTAEPSGNSLLALPTHLT